MDQTNNVAMSMLQSIASQATQLPKTSKTEDGELSDFQKLLEKKSQEKDPLVEERPKAQTKAETTAPKKDKAPQQKQENPLEQVKKLAEQGYALSQPNVGAVPFDPNNVTLGQTETGEYVVMQLGEEGEVLSVIELDPWQQQQLQQLIHNMDLMAQAQDPEADAMLEMTAPDAEIDPAQLLETALDNQAGEVVQQVVEEANSQQKDEGQTVEVVDVEQAPRQLFHDVEAAPVKVGEVYDAQQTETPNVAQQIDTQVAQALQQGESVVRVQLNPENLGEVTVEIRQSVDGILHVALNAHSSETRGLLERHAGELQGLLSSRGTQEVQVDVQRQSESQQGQNQQHQNYDGRNGHAQDEQQERRRQQREHTSSQDFMQQLRLGLIPADGEF